MAPNNHLTVFRTPADRNSADREWKPFYLSCEICLSVLAHKLMKTTNESQTDRFQKCFFYSFPRCQSQTMYLFHAKQKLLALEKEKSVSGSKWKVPSSPSVCSLPTPVSFHSGANEASAASHSDVINRLQ